MSRKTLNRQALLALACCSLMLGACAAHDAGVAPAPAEPPPPPVLTEEQKIIARYVDAIGGEDALRAYSSATTRGAFEMPAMGMSGDMTVYQMAPDKNLVTISFPGMGEAVQGYNGQIAWAEDAMQGARLVEGEMLAQARREARFHGELEYEELYPEQTAIGETEWNGQTVYQLDLVDADGNESSRYFATDTGLLVGAEETMTNEMGTADVTLTFDKYKEFDGVTLATSTSTSLMGMEYIITIESVSWDDVDPSVFEPSDAIKALLPE